MLRVKSKVSILKLADRSVISKTAHNFFAAQFRNALRAWVKAILTEIPDYTGTYRGTIIPVGRALGGGGWSHPGPVFTYNEKMRSWHKSTGHKIIRGRGTFQIGEAGGAKATEFTIADGNPGLYVFTYKTNLPWAIWNEMRSAPAWMHLHMPTPAQAIPKGNAAFKYYLENDMPTRSLYKKLAKIMIKSSIKSA